MSNCPYVVMEVRKGLPSHLATVNEELTEILCEAWEERYIERTFEAAEKYVDQMNRNGMRRWIE